MRNSENLRARIMKNRALDRNIWLWKPWMVKWSFWKVLGVFVEFMSGWKFWHERTRALAKIGNFLDIFGEFFECLE
jgi:hypothetical protein